MQLAFPQCAEQLWPLYSTLHHLLGDLPLHHALNHQPQGHTSGPLMMPLFSWLETGKRLPSR